MPDQIVEQFKLMATTKENEARYVGIKQVLFKGCRVTEGKLYEVRRDLTNRDLFEFGEIFITDDDGKPNYSVFMMCITQLYK
ncbi:hypothetical protein [Paenibacillus sp. J22TS3]|uniref:hypothetical protein n=1 Tax=Paenibacillus sp. J22TS3 TaxID=2807192 RepID=UPI001B1B1D8E|nr:hypothetical protein [Paenibacillus sp. J22TS3]GIP20161.1 hypothetical protein J22TS3_04360 [Paenibacillus sp. J22TS3]